MRERPGRLPVLEGHCQGVPHLAVSKETLECTNKMPLHDMLGCATTQQYNQEIFFCRHMGAVNYVVRGMRELPGRKAVVLFSDGFALYDLDNGNKKPNPRLVDSFKRLTELANRASVIIYTMDARGVVNALMANAEDSFEDFIKSGRPDCRNKSWSVAQLSYMSRRKGCAHLPNKPVASPLSITTTWAKVLSAS